MVWEAANAFIESDIIIVSPRVTFARLFELARTAVFWQSIGTTLSRVLFGFTLAMLSGILIAALSANCKPLYNLILPAMKTINAVPVASFVILALFAFKLPRLSVFIAFITVLPISFFNAHKGIINTDPQLLEMAKIFNVPAYKKIFYIYFKTVAPYITTAATVGIGFAWKSGIAAELIGVVGGTIGANLHNARIFLNTADLFAWTIAIIILSYIMERAFRLFFQVIKWQSN